MRGNFSGMQRPHEAYSKVATSTVIDAREFDASILLKAAGRFQRIRDEWADGNRKELSAALLYNRKIWTVYASAVVEQDHPLPKEIRQNLANLAVFIFKHSIDVEIGPAPEMLDVLININRNIAAGLLQKPS